MNKLWSVAFLFLLAATLGGCASSSPDVIGRGEAQRLAVVDDAVVVSVRSVTVDGSQSGAGAVAGGVVGGLVGYGAGGGQRSSQATGVIGSVVGAAAGNIIERFSTREDAVEIVLQLRNGERRAIVQAKGVETFAPGDAVILVSSGGKVRVARK